MKDMKKRNIVNFPLERRRGIDRLLWENLKQTGEAHLSDMSQKIMSNIRNLQKQSKNTDYLNIEIVICQAALKSDGASCASKQKKQ